MPLLACSLRARSNGSRQRLFFAVVGALLAVVGTGALVNRSTHAFPTDVTADPAPIDYGRDIRPILSDTCFRCHGADEGTREAGLRLDLRDDALAVIDPGNPDDSELLRRILADGDERMPPPESPKSLKPEQIELLRRWIAEGAEYRGHWAFEPIRRPEVPKLKNAGGARNEIDAFVHAALERRGVTASPPADRATLIRRLYQDVLGLLPTPEETARFLADERTDAYEQLVEEVLRSPHYGERWGRHWLDQARYADSHGHTIDGARIMWPYRDWVIQAVNQDMPFDQFTIEQLAGDLLENPTPQQLVATAFHRNTLINQEGGVKADQYKHEAVIDRVNTTGAVWLGLTIGCAQCHTHKFDPILHTDYYQLYSFFNRCVDANDQGPTTPVLEGEMFHFTAEQQAALAELRKLRKSIKKQEQEAQASSGDRFQTTEWNWRGAEVTDYRTQNKGRFERLQDGSLLHQGEPARTDDYFVSFRSPVTTVRAVRIRALPHPSLPNGGPGLAGNGNFILSEFELEADGSPVEFSEAWADHAQPNYPIDQAIDGEKTTGWAVSVTDEQKVARPDLRMNEAREAIFVLKQPLDIGNSVVTAILRHQQNNRYLLGRFIVEVSDVALPSADSMLPPALLAARARAEELQSQLPGSPDPVNQMILRDLPEPPPTYRLDRGDFLTPDLKLGPLAPGVPAALVPSGVELPTFTNRLDLAKWLVSPDNPLTARVTMNRIWMRYFGAGLVETENDFGLQGVLPSHPELLDWLASEFMRQGWSMKAMHRLIVNSATYRQTSDTRPELKADPSNRWLARQSRFRVEAEIVRDLALSASGLLTPKIGGPSVHPPQPDGVYSFTQTKKAWPESQGPDRYRRTMYTMLYRSAPYPLLQTFDAPDFSTVCTQRPRSDTPLQSLTLANDPMFFEIAQGLATRVVREVPGACSEQTDADAGIERMFQLCLTRSPTPHEVTLLENYWNAERRRYEADPKAAGDVAAKTLREAGQPIAVAAAWTSVARVLLNTDEFVSRN